MKISLNVNPSKRLYYLLIGLVGLLLIGLVAGTYETNQILVSHANKLTSLKAQSQALSDEQLSLVKAKQQLTAYNSLLKITQTVVPEDKDQAEAVREIVNIAANNGVDLESINFPASTLGTTGSSSAPVGSGVAVAPTAPARASSVSASSKAAQLSQLLPVKNIPGVYDLLITVQSNANDPVLYSSFISFLHDLEHNRRTAQISTITLQPSVNNRNLLSFTLTLNEYIKP